MAGRLGSVGFAARITALVLPLALVALPAAAERVALVIGNAAYAHAPRLANPLNDAADIGAALRRLGFAVTRLENADYAALRRGLLEFTRAAAASEIAVVFYAGHGIEVDRRNFLVPVDARLLSDADVEFETVPLELVSRAVERARGLALVILDACRENPFAASMQRAGATRAIGRGLARIEPSGETLVAYAAKEGTVASDGRGRNSPYSAALLKHIEEPGLEVGLMFRKVRDAVLAATGGAQEPFVYGSLSSEGAYFTAAPGPAATAGATPTGSPGGANGSARLTAEQLAAERLFWESVKDSDDPAELEAYRDRYPGGTYEALAVSRLERLKRAAEEPEDMAGASAASAAAPPAASTSREDAVAAEASLGLVRADRRSIQAGLASLGFDPGSPDGLFGKRTRAAIAEWQSAQGSAATGYLDAETARTLLAAAPPPGIETRLPSGPNWFRAQNQPCMVWTGIPESRKTVTWSGGCTDGMASGWGKLVWNNGDGEDVFEGEVSRGKLHGRGSYLWANGERYEGEWRDSRRNGHGTLTFPSGERYEGEWRDDRPNGYGTLTWADGSRYEGNFADGNRHGRGTYTLADGGRHEGEWRDDRPNGYGTLTWADGSRYEGNFADSKRHGRGTFTWPDGMHHEGEWRDDRRNGHGTQTWPDGRRYVGNFADGKRHGRGTFTWPDGERYEGNFADDKRHGRGVQTWPSGQRYEGEWRDGKLYNRE